MFYNNVGSNDPFASNGFQPHHNTTMEVNGLKCVLNMPKAVPRRFNADGTEAAVGLPPYSPRAAFAVDEYEASPDSCTSEIAKGAFGPLSLLTF